MRHLPIFARQRARQTIATFGVCLLFFISTAGATAFAEGRAGHGDDHGYGDYTYRQNVVRVINHSHGETEVRGEVQFNRFRGTSAHALNKAYGYSSCVGCTTIAVALQINLVSPRATTVHLEDVAIAQNYRCQNCTTVALALEFSVVGDPTLSAPEDINEQIAWMNHQFTMISRDHKMSLATAEQRVGAVVSRFVALTNQLTGPQNTAGVRSATPHATPQLKYDRKETNAYTSPNTAPLLAYMTGGTPSAPGTSGTPIADAGFAGVRTVAA